MRRYKYLKYENGRHLGDHGGCVQGILARSWTDWFVRCHNCFCTCDETDPASDRYFRYPLGFVNGAKDDKLIWANIFVYFA